MIVRTWRAAREQDGSITEAEVRTALTELDPLWDELFPAEQARIVQLLVERVEISTDRHRPDAQDRRADQPRPGSAGRRPQRGSQGGMSEATISPDGATVTISVPLQFRKRGGRKQVVVPDGHCCQPVTRPQIDSTLVKAIARAHRWQRMLESGDYASIAELAAAEQIKPSYLARVLRLTLLAPGLVERILNGQAPEVTLGWLLKTMPTDWERQV